MKLGLDKEQLSVFEIVGIFVFIVAFLFYYVYQVVKCQILKEIK